LALGWINVDEMLTKLSSAQMAEWEAFYLLEPFGFEYNNHAAGMIASTIANCSMTRRKDKKPFEPKMFFPNPEELLPVLQEPEFVKVQPVDEMMSVLMTMATPQKKEKRK
jgi:flagellar basal body rod protein FlgC